MSVIDIINILASLITIIGAGIAIYNAMRQRPGQPQPPYPVLPPYPQPPYPQPPYPQPSYPVLPQAPQPAYPSTAPRVPYTYTFWTPERARGFGFYYGLRLSAIAGVCLLSWALIAVEGPTGQSQSSDFALFLSFLALPVLAYLAGLHPVKTTGEITSGLIGGGVLSVASGIFYLVGDPFVQVVLVGPPRGTYYQYGAYWFINTFLMACFIAGFEFALGATATLIGYWRYKRNAKSLATRSGRR